MHHHDELAKADPSVFGDKRLDKRLLRITSQLTKSPRASLPDMMRDEAGLEGCYRFMRNEKVTTDAILSTHQAQTLAALDHHEVTLSVADTTAFRMKECDGDSQGLGPLTGKSGAQGFFCHTTLMQSVDGKPLGIGHVHNFVRKIERVSKSKRKGLMDPDNERGRWLEAMRNVESWAKDSATRLIHVADRESDMFELIEAALAENMSFVIRAKRKRMTESRNKEAQPRYRPMEEVLDMMPYVCQRDVPISKRRNYVGSKKRNKAQQKSHPSRDKRTATLSFYAEAMNFRYPAKISRQDKTSAQWNVVYVSEKNPPTNQPPVSWILFTSEPIDTEQQVLTIIDYYRGRWQIEELFKAIKSGCAFESRQFRSYNALQNMLATTLPVACSLLTLRWSSRQSPDEPATNVVAAPLLEVLLALDPKLPTLEKISLKQALWAIASLGGHLKRNGPPGWSTLGKGYQKLLAYRIGWNAKNNL